MVHTHRNVGALAFKDAHEFDDLAATFQVRRFHKVAVVEDMDASQVDEVDAGQETLSHGRQVVVRPGK